MKNDLLTREMNLKTATMWYIALMLYVCSLFRTYPARRSSLQGKTVFAKVVLVCVEIPWVSYFVTLIGYV